MSRNKAAKEAGLSERQKHTALRIANVPSSAFEQQLESDAPPKERFEPRYYLLISS